MTLPYLFYSYTDPRFRIKEKDVIQFRNGYSFEYDLDYVVNNLPNGKSIVDVKAIFMDNVQLDASFVVGTKFLEMLVETKSVGGYLGQLVREQRENIEFHQIS
jgi:hypothetical protein